MKNLNRYFVLFSLACSFQSFSQTAVVKSSLSTNKALPTVTKPVEVLIPLPSVLLSFDAISNDKQVELTWASNTENTNNFFTIEKSKDAVNFETVTSIKGFGNHSSLINYFDVDLTPYSGISYYRLKQTDNNGNVLSSRLVSVNYKFNNDGLSVYPNSSEENPANLLGSENKEVLVVLRDGQGVESYKKVIIDEKNTVIFPSNENKLDNGVYLIVASSDNKLFSQVVTVR